VKAKQLRIGENPKRQNDHDGTARIILMLKVGLTRGIRQKIKALKDSLW
jgi:hypothetical protein